MVTLVRRLAGFSTLPFLAAILPLIALPIISRAAVPEEWVALNVGLSVGGFAGAVGLGGWNVLGTPLVALADSDERRIALYGRSFWMRLLIVIVASVVAAGISAWISPGSWLVAAVFAVAGAVNGLELNWYAVGVSSPGIIVRYEIVPRAILTAIAIVIVLLTGAVLWYGALLIIAIVGGSLAFHRRLYGRLLPPRTSWRRIREDMVEMRHAWGVESIGNLYGYAPVPIASSVASVDPAAAYSSSDKIYRYGTLAVSAVGNAVQGWVLEVSDARRRTRNLVALGVMLLVGVIGLLFLTFAGVPFSGWLFGADKAGDPAAFLYLGIAFLASSTSTPLIRNVIMPARRDHVLLVVRTIATVVGLAAMILLGLAFGVVGVAVGFAGSEAFMLVVCVVLSLRIGLDAKETRSLSA